MSETITARVRATGKVWEVRVDGVDAPTLARTAHDVPQLAAELAALHRGGDAADYDVEVVMELPARWREEWARAAAAKDERDAADLRYRQARYLVVTGLRQDGVTWGDIADMLGVSAQTVRLWGQDEPAGTEGVAN